MTDLTVDQSREIAQRLAAIRVTARDCALAMDAAGVHDCILEVRAIEQELIGRLCTRGLVRFNEAITTSTSLWHLHAVTSAWVHHAARQEQALTEARAFTQGYVEQDKAGSDDRRARGGR